MQTDRSMHLRRHRSQARTARSERHSRKLSRSCLVMTCTAHMKNLCCSRDADVSQEGLAHPAALCLQGDKASVLSAAQGEYHLQAPRAVLGDQALQPKAAPRQHLRPHIAARQRRPHHLPRVEGRCHWGDTTEKRCRRSGAQFDHEDQGRVLRHIDAAQLETRWEMYWASCTTSAGAAASGSDFVFCSCLRSGLWSRSEAGSHTRLEDRLDAAGRRWHETGAHLWGQAVKINPEKERSSTSRTLGWVLRRIMACRYTARGLMVNRCRRYSPANATIAAESDCIRQKAGWGPMISAGLRHSQGCGHHATLVRLQVLGGAAGDPTGGSPGSPALPLSLTG